MVLVLVFMVVLLFDGDGDDVVWVLLVVGCVVMCDDDDDVMVVVCCDGCGDVRDVCVVMVLMVVCGKMMWKCGVRRGEGREDDVWDVCGWEDVCGRDDEGVVLMSG